MLKPRPLRVLALALLLAALPGCPDKLDEAARARIFSPEDPPPDVVAARQKLNVADATKDGDLWARLWNMDRLEVTHRIGAHKAHGVVHFKWSTGDRTVELTEDQTFETDAQGEYHATVHNDQDAGFELIWVDGKAYARGRYGAFHPRRTDQAQEDLIRNQATSALPTFFGLFQRQLHGAPDGQETWAGRPATAFTLALGEPWGPKREESGPPPVYGQTRDGTHGALHPGPDADTALRLAFDQKEVPGKVSGEILVDDAGVIVKASARARIHVADVPGRTSAILEIDVQYELSPTEVSIQAPTDVVSLKLPHVVNDPLWFTRSSAPAAASEEDDAPGEDDDAPTPRTRAPAHVNGTH